MDAPFSFSNCRQNRGSPGASHNTRSTDKRFLLGVLRPNVVGERLSMNTAPQDVLVLEQQLQAWFAPWKSCAVALSGGVDSAVVAKAAQRVLGERAIALTASSPSVAESELQTACQIARQIGIRHRILETSEIENPLYQRNAPDRCFHCKSELYQRMTEALADEPVEVLVNGTNADDLKDFRPGLQAAEQYRVRSPLAECGFGKVHVRQLAHHWNLPIWDKPASPCLASRIAYGVEVTAERLKMVEHAESFLKSLGFPVVRVRLHPGNLARIEVPQDELSRLVNTAHATALVAHLQKIGFRYVTVDLQGFRSGSLNEVLPVEMVLKP